MFLKDAINAHQGCIDLKNASKTEIIKNTVKKSNKVNYFWNLTFSAVITPVLGDT